MWFDVAAEPRPIALDVYPRSAGGDRGNAPYLTIQIGGDTRAPPLDALPRSPDQDRTRVPRVVRVQGEGSLNPGFTELELYFHPVPAARISQVGTSRSLDDVTRSGQPAEGEGSSALRTETESAAVPSVGDSDICTTPSVQRNTVAGSTDTQIKSWTNNII